MSPDRPWNKFVLAASVFFCSSLIAFAALIALTFFDDASDAKTKTLLVLCIVAPPPILFFALKAVRRIESTRERGKWLAWGILMVSIAFILFELWVVYAVLTGIIVVVPSTLVAPQ